MYRLARAAEFRDSETGLHLVRMAYSCERDRRIGRALQDDLSCLTDARRWESRTPDAILLKPGRLTADEFTIMKTHAHDGYDILRDSESSLLCYNSYIRHKY